MKWLVYLTNSLLVLLVVAAVVFGVRYLLENRPIRQEIRTSLASQYQQIAEQYKRRMGDYEGMCTELAARDRVQCQSTATQYRIFVATQTGGYLCADSSGFDGTVDGLSRTSTLCQ